MSSTRSSTSSATTCLMAEIDRAILTAQAARLKQKLALERQDAKIQAENERREAKTKEENERQEAQSKAKKEKLQIDTTVAATDAKLRVWQMHEGLNAARGDSKRSVNQPVVHTIHKTSTFGKASSHSVTSLLRCQ